MSPSVHETTVGPATAEEFLITCDFIDEFEEDPAEALDLLLLLLVDEDLCHRRVDALRDRNQHFRELISSLTIGDEHTPSDLSNDPAFELITKQDRPGATRARVEFEDVSRLIRRGLLRQAVATGELDCPRLGRLANDPDALWEAHCVMLDSEPVRPAKDDLIRLSRAFHLPAIASARSLSHSEDFRQEITIAGCPAIAEVLDLDDQWLVRVQTRRAEVCEVTLVVRLVETDESASGDAFVSSLQVVDEFDNEDAASQGWPIVLKGTSDGWFVGSVTVSADEVAREIDGRSFSVVLLVAQAEQFESDGLPVEPTDEQPGQSVGNDLGFTPGWTDKVELVRLLGKTAAVSQETRASAGETVPAGVGAAGKVTAFDASSHRHVVLLIDPLPWVVMWGLDDDGTAVASRRDWESNVRTLCERAGRKLSSRSTSEKQTSQREELVNAVEEAATEAGLEWRRRIDTDEDWDAFALQTVVGVVLSQAAPREFEWERHFREWLLEQRIQTADDLRRLEFPDSSIPAQDLVAAQTRWYEQVLAGLAVFSVGKPAARQEV